MNAIATNNTAMNHDAVNAAHGTVTAPGTLRLERVLPGPIERVWAYLTESDKRAEWLARGDMDLRVGGAVELTWFNSELSGGLEATPERYQKYEGHSMRSRITACEPPRLLAFTWGESPDRESGQCEVKFELSERGDDVLLVLTHRGLRDRDQMLSVAAGWHSHVGILVDRLAGRTPSNFWAKHAGLEAEYAQRLPAAD